MQEPWVQSLDWEAPLEKEMAPHSSILAWEIHGQRSLVGYSPGGHKRVGHDLATKPSPPLYIYYAYILAVAIGFLHL